MWTTKGREGENAALVTAGELVMAMTTEGELVILRRNPKAFDPVKRYTLAESAVWAHPAPWRAASSSRMSIRLRIGRFETRHPERRRASPTGAGRHQDVDHGGRSLPLRVVGSGGLGAKPANAQRCRARRLPERPCANHWSESRIADHRSRRCGMVTAKS